VASEVLSVNINHKELLFLQKVSGGKLKFKGQRLDLFLSGIFKGTSNNSKFVTPVKTGVQGYQDLLDSGRCDSKPSLSRNDDL